MEIESSGYLINKILNFANFPVLFYQLSMLSFFLINQRYSDVILIFFIFICSTIYVFCNLHTYVLDIYSLNNSLRVYDNNTMGISLNEINKWRNKFKHPLVLPIHIDKDDDINSSRIYSFKEDNLDSPRKMKKNFQTKFSKNFDEKENNNNRNFNEENKSGNLLSVNDKKNVNVNVKKNVNNNFNSDNDVINVKEVVATNENDSQIIFK